jgi:hypothetical protein
MFFGSVKITELERWELPIKNLDHFGNSHSMASSHFFQIEVGIDIEISHLDEIELGPSNQFHPSLHFFLPIGKSRENEKVNGGIDSFFFRQDQGSYNFSEGISLGSVIEREIF